MITGHNTDIEYNGRVYHVQTEDKGLKNPVIETLIYQKGHILGSKKISYADLVARGGGEREIQERLEAQHKRTLIEVKSGRYDPQGPPPFGDNLISKRSFDQVVLDYLRGAKGSERLELAVQGPPELRTGEKAEIEIFTRAQGSGKPVGSVPVSIRVSHSKEGEVELFHGDTDSSGLLTAKVDIPPFEEPGAIVLIVEATSDQGQEQTRMVVHPAVPEPAGKS
jgi:hypothetical protein